jgi:hypothetical protein
VQVVAPLLKAVAVVVQANQGLQMLFATVVTALHHQLLVQA